MANTMPQQITLPSLWNSDEIEVTDDGFLWLKNLEKKDEEQPLLLYSTEFLLQKLYPGMTRDEIFKEVGHTKESLVTTEEAPVVANDITDDSEAEESNGESSNNIAADDDDPSSAPTEKDEKKSSKAKAKIPPKYNSYQVLKLEDNLDSLLVSALLDIKYFRHRTRAKKREYTKSSIQDAKIRALEHAQERLAASRATSSISNESDNAISDDTEKQQVDSSKSNNNEEEESDGEVGAKESPAVRLARTINSIRALFPHVLPILNHPLRSDKELIIGKSRWKSRKKGEMCWVLGTKVFGYSSKKLSNNTYWDARGILESYIDVDMASKIAEHPTGAPDFWMTSWVSQIAQKGTSVVENPLDILVRGDSDLRHSVQAGCESCDATFIAKKRSNTPGKTKEQYDKAIKLLHSRLSNILKGRFPKARLSMYGSCLSDLSLGQASDVDLSLWLPGADELKKGYHDGTIGASKYEKGMKSIVYQATRVLEHKPNEFRGMQPVTRARVPVVKGTYLKADNPHSPDGSIHFDICFMNDIAVANSQLIREYSLVDPRARDLMLAVKRWAKEFKINSAKDNTISSYTWTNMAIFYLQCLGFVPNFQCRKLMNAVGVRPDPEHNIWHSVDGLDTCTLTWAQVRNANAWEQPNELKAIPVSALLYGFFEFYSRRFPSALYAVSIKRGNISLPRTNCRRNSVFLCIEDPFETFDSYCPHDLGSHANELGVKDIVQFLGDSELYLREVLLGTAKTEGGGLWPEPPFVEPEPPRQYQKNAQFRRFEPLLNGGAGVPIGGNGSKQPLVHGETQVRSSQSQGRNFDPKKGKQGRRRGPKGNNTQNGRSNQNDQSTGPQNGRKDEQQSKGDGHAGGQENSHQGHRGPRRPGRDNAQNGKAHQNGPPGQSNVSQHGQHGAKLRDGHHEGQKAGSQGKKGKPRSSQRGRRNPGSNNNGNKMGPSAS